MLYQRGGKVREEKITAHGMRRGDGRDCYKEWQMLANVEVIFEAEKNNEYD